MTKLAPCPHSGIATDGGSVCSLARVLVVVVGCSARTARTAYRQLELDEVTFREPVSVGDLVRFESAVLYTSEVMDVLGRLTVHVEVRANVIKPEARTSVTSNTFNFTFGVADDSGRSARGGGGMELKRVVPATHEQAYRILERYKADLVQRSEDESHTASV